MARRPVTITSALVAALLAGGALAGCSTGTPIDNILNGAVEQGQERARQAADDALKNVLGGAEVSTDGQLPAGFPTQAVPVTGTVLGGGAAPGGSGWVARSQLTGLSQFADAESALTGAGFSVQLSDATERSAFGQYSSDAYDVSLAVTTEDSSVIATYVVTARD